MGKILITGATGNVGRYTAEYLLGAGEEVKAASKSKDKVTKLFGNAAEYCEFDFQRPETFDGALKETDRVFLMRPPQMGNPEELYPFLDAVKKKGDIRLVVFLSLQGAEKNPMPPHHKIEKYMIHTSLPYCFMRPGFFMQNLSGVHAFEIKYFDRIVVPAGKSLTGFIDAKDIGDISGMVLSRPEGHEEKAYEITGPEAIDYYKAAEILSQELGRKITYTEVSPGKALYYWTHIRGLEEEYSKVMNMLYRLTRMGMAKTVTDDFEKITGRKARSFQEFVRENKESWI